MSHEPTYDSIKCELNNIISENLKKLLRANNLSQTILPEYLRGRNKVSVSRTQINKILNKNQNIEATLLLCIADCFSIPVHDFVNPDFDISKYSFTQTASNEYVDIERITKASAASSADQIHKIPVNQKGFSFFFEGKNLIVDPKNDFFKGHLQSYYIYYYPTYGLKAGEPALLLTGRFELAPEGDLCRATLTIDTETYNDFGKKNYKVYTGVMQ